MGIFICPNCGSETRSAVYGLRTKNYNSGAIKQCSNCRYSNRKTKHGMSNSKLYGVWTSIKQRCTNPKDSSYPNYGGRGITLYTEWIEFEPFMSWALANGYKEGLDTERLDNELGYSPSNVRWKTRKENLENTRRSIKNKMTENEISDMVECYCNTDITIKELAGICPIGPKAISKIIKDSDITIRTNKGVG